MKNNLKYMFFLFKSLGLIPKYFRENKLTYKNVISFLQGTYRLYHLSSQPVHILEQLYFRVSRMRKECLDKGFCVFCGCPNIDLQLSQPSCSQQCYPELMDSDTWKTYKIVFGVNVSECKLFFDNYVLRR